MQGQLVDVVADSRWFPDGLDLEKGAMVFLDTSRERVASSAFLDQRMDRRGLTHQGSRLEDLAGLTAPAKAPRFIWHTTFCCSTLLARCLDKPGSNLSLKEPNILMSIANIKRNQGIQAVQAWLGPALNALARPMEAGEAVTIKPTNLVNNLIAETMACSPQSQHLFMTSDLRAFLVSIAKKGEAGRAFARQVFTILAMDGHPIAETEHRQLMQLSDLQIAALVWHMQVSVFQDAMARAKPGQIAWLDGDDFVRRPKQALRAVDDFFGLGLGQAFTDATATGPLLTRDAKDQSRNYGASLRAQEARKTAQSLGRELDSIIDWSYSLFPNAPRDGRLPHALLPQ